MNSPDQGELQRELEKLRDRLAAVARAQADEVAQLRRSIDALERRLATPAINPIVEMAAAPEPLSSPEPPPFPAPAAEAVVPEAPGEIPAPPGRPAAPRGSFELRFGRVWLVRLGIALLVTGLVLLGNHAYQNWVRDLPAAARLAALYLGALLICGTGVHLARRENLQRFGEVLLAGGLAFFYWCTFAAHHVPRLQVVASPVTGALLLLGAASVIVAVSLRRESRATAVMGLLLASYSTVLQPLGWLSAVSNLILAGAGTGLMLRRGWATPGIAAMAGTYAAFLWWQVAGAIGGRPDNPAALGFLPPVWAIFALPGVLGISRHFESLGERGRCWFAGANNAAFFLLFSAVWLEQRSSDGYWIVPAVFGAVLLALGIAGRSRDAAGGVHLAQGLGALSLAMALKLDGYHLALGFAGQTLALALAFRRFGGKSELGFAAMAAVIAIVLSLDSTIAAPVWSRALAAALVLGAAFPLRDGCDRMEPGSHVASSARFVTSLALLGGGLLALVFCADHVPEFWQLPATSAMALGWAGFTLLVDRARRLPEAAWLAGVFGIMVLGLLVDSGGDLPAWSPALAGLLALAGHWLWAERVGPGKLPAHDPAGWPIAFLLLTALTATAAIYRILEPLDLSAPQHLLAFGAAAVALAALGRRGIPSPVLQVAATLLLPATLGYQLALGDDDDLFQFVPAAAGLGMVTLSGAKSTAGILARAATVISWLFAWHQIAPAASGDIIAASGLALGIAVFRMKAPPLPESWILLGCAVLQLLLRIAAGPWQPLDAPPFPHGGIVVASLLACAVLLRPVTRQPIRQLILYTASALLALWSSQAIVWHFDWKPVAILWTLLGFGLVSGGLWGKISALRHAGFVLLALALAKLFLIDVWDFATFTRVAAFLALGGALVLLGFFYNRFADVLKMLFESDAT